MTMLPQPPPNAEAPLPSEAALRSRRYWQWIWVTGVISMVVGFFWLTRPIVIRSHRKSDLTEAVNNARQIGLALFEFGTEYGSYPDATTIAAVRKKTGTLLPLGMKTSNDYFRQLLGAGVVQSEPMFYAKIKGTRKPDGSIDPAQALSKGEVGFAYLTGLTVEGNPSRPIVVTPLIPGTDRFDPEPFDGRAIILKMDNSITSMIIGKDGRVMVSGKNLLDPTNPVWGNEKWKLVWPE